MAPLLLVGCAAAVDGREPYELDLAEDESVAAYLEARGLDASTLERIDESLVAEGDIGFDLETLREAGAELVEKGWTFIDTGATSCPGFPFPCGPVTSIAQRKLGNIRLEFVTGLSAAWVTAYTQAAAEWTNARAPSGLPAPWGGADIPISIRTTNTGARILVGPVDLSSAGGVGYFPVGGDPGPLVFADSTPNACLARTANFGPQWRKVVALHELGHTLGLAHPGDGRRVPSTSQFATGLADSIMVPGVPSQCADSGPTATVPSSDDKLSLYLLYGCGHAGQLVCPILSSTWQVTGTQCKPGLTASYAVCM